MRIGIIVQSVVMTVAVLAAFVYGLSRFPNNLEGAQTVAFVTLICSELLRAYTARSEHYPLYRIGLFSNRSMLLATAISFVLLLAVVYVPFLDPIFHTVELAPREWLVIAPLMFLPAIAAEITKFFLRRRGTRVTGKL
jgi:Ca2+-transporting ATPase